MTTPPNRIYFPFHGLTIPLPKQNNRLFKIFFQEYNLTVCKRGGGMFFHLVILFTAAGQQSISFEYEKLWTN